MAYRFHYAGNDYNKKVSIDNVVNPTESLSINLPLGSTVNVNLFNNENYIRTQSVYVEKSITDDVYMTSVNDYTWGE